MANLPNGGVSLTTPQAPASAASFARKNLMQAMAQGLLPNNFKLANTNANLIGQFHQLHPALLQAQHNGGATQDNLSAIMQAIGGLGQNNLVSRGQQAQYGTQGQLPNGGNSGIPQQGGFQQALLQMLFGQLQTPNVGNLLGTAAPYFNPSNPSLY